MALFFTNLSQDLLANPGEAMKYIEQTLWKVAFHNLKKHKPSQESVENNVKGIFYLAKGKKLPQPHLASEETIANEISLLDGILKQQYENKRASFSKATEKGLKTALREDEVVELESRFTYLEMPFNSFPKYTPVFLRRTNLSEYCLIVTGYLVRCSQVRKQDRGQEGNEFIYYQEPELKGLEDVTNIASGLGKGLLKGIGGQVGALIFNAIFPSGTPDYFNDVYKEVEKIVHKEITDNTIHEVNGKINGTKDWVAITYTNAKESGTESKKELTELLRPRESQIAIDLVGVLMEERFAQPGLSVFMIAACMHLAILQELAFVDPKAASPSDSSYATSVKEYAEKYADHAKATFGKIMETRLSQVQPGVWFGYVNPNPPPGTPTYVFFFKDKFTGRDEGQNTMSCGAFGCHPKDAEEKRNEAMKKYKEDTRKDLVAKMEDPKATADEWLKLKTQYNPSRRSEKTGKSEMLSNT